MKIFNSMTMQKEEFIPIEEGKVSIYSCGPTVYNFIHVGNARPIIMFDVLRRYLEYRGYESAGIAILEDGKFKVVKAKGKVSELQKKIQAEWPVGKESKAKIGIAQTRRYRPPDPRTGDVDPIEAFLQAGRNFDTLSDGIAGN